MDNMQINKILLIILVILLSSIGCISRSSSSVSYIIDVAPAEDSETTLIIPLVINMKTNDIAEVMFVNPRFPKGSALIEIVQTDKGPALKIITNGEVEIDFSKYYEESGAELRLNRTYSLTNITFDDKGKQVTKGWIYLNSTTNITPLFRFTLMAGDKDRIRKLDVSGRNVSNGWHQFAVEEGIGIS